MRRSAGSAVVWGPSPVDLVLGEVSLGSFEPIGTPFVKSPTLDVECGLMLLEARKLAVAICGTPFGSCALVSLPVTEIADAVGVC